MSRIPSKITFLLSVSFLLLLSSCQLDDEVETSQDFSTDNATKAAIADNVVEGTLNLMESGYSENEEDPNPLNSNSLFPPCTTITITTNGNGGTIQLDFGTSCELNNGAVVSGMMLLDYGPVVSGTRTINYSFDNFTYNGNGVAGGGEIFRELANTNGNPQSTVNESITVSFPNTDVTATRTGLRIAEWTEGVGTGTWTDNVYEISGNWDTVITNGFTRSGEVTEVLVKKLSCLYIVSGKIIIEQQNLTGEINWGDGECDNVATITINGIEYTIILN